jgi:2-methylcitrate dehydratase PrpD
VDSKLVSNTARWVAELAWADVPEEVREATIRGVLHSIAGGVAGITMPETRVALDVARREGETGPGTILVDGMSVPTATAIFVNSVMFGAFEQQEMHAESGTHPLEVVVPVALAVAQRQHSSGSECLLAILAGVEVIVAFGAEGLRHVPSKSFGTCHGAAVYGVLGATATAARLAGLGADQIGRALSLAANLAAGLREAQWAGTTEYHYSLANASRNGYLAAQLAVSGAEATSTAFEGRAGFYHRFAELSSDDLDVADLGNCIVGKLGRQWGMPEHLYKPYPVHFYNLPYLDAARYMRTRFRIDPFEIVEVRIAINEWSLSCDGGNLGPYFGREATRGATAFAIAAMLARGKFGSAEADDYAAPDISRLVERCRIARFADSEVARDWRSVRIEIVTLQDRYVFDSRVDEVRDYRLPMGEIKVMAQGHLIPLFGVGQAARIIDTVTGMASIDDVAVLGSMLVRS